MRTMTMKTATAKGKAAGLQLRRAVLCAVVALSLTNCHGLLDVRDPDIVTPPDLSDPVTALPIFRAGAIGDFALAYGGSGADGSGGTEGMILASGLLGDELVNSETFPTRIEVDARSIQITNATATTWFRTLHRARRATEVAADKYATLSTSLTSQSGYPEMLALAGFTYVFFAENYCSGVPMSKVNADGSFTFGQPRTTTEILDTAVARFNAAIAAAIALDTTVVSANTRRTMIRLAVVGKARAQVALGDFPGAVTTLNATTVGAATPVPTSFAYVISHSEVTGRENNGVFLANVTNERYSVADREGNYAASAPPVGIVGTGPGLPWRSQPDPRTPFRRIPSTDRGFDGITAQFDNLRFGNRNAPIPLATGLEARLIEAEAALQPGGAGATTWLNTLNALRAAPPDYIGIDTISVAIVPTAALANLTDPGTPTAQQDLQFSERARWLWLSAHRLGDMRRLIRQYGRAENTVFPNGDYFKQGRVYGADVNFPVPFDEENNPDFSQCIDRLP